MKQLYLFFSLSFFFTATLLHAQNVGVGTNTPTEKLDVDGNLRVRSLLGEGLRSVLVDEHGVLVASRAYESAPNDTILLNGCASEMGVVDVIAISGQPMISPELISVTVNINHPYVEDLRIFLASPSGDTLTLFRNNGGGGDNLSGTTFTDSGSPLNAGSAPFTGLFPAEWISGPGLRRGLNGQFLWRFRGRDDRSEW